MGVGYVEEVWNNGPGDIYVRSVDTIHNGDWTVDGTFVNLDGGDWHKMPKGNFNMRYFGIPWYDNGKKYKEFKADPDSDEGVRIYQTEQEGETNVIMWVNIKTGRTIAKQSVPASGGYKMKMCVDADGGGGFYLEVVNSQWSTYKTIDAIGNTIAKVADFVIMIAEAIVGLKKP